MTDSEIQPESREPSEAELRLMLEEREHEKDAALRQTSRKFSIILAVFIAVLAVAVLCFPDREVPAASSPLAHVELPAPVPTALNPDPTNSDPQLAGDLKPFMIQPGAKGGNTEDVRFVFDLFHFMDAADFKPAVPHKTAAPATKP